MRDFRSPLTGIRSPFRRRNSVVTVASQTIEFGALTPANYGGAKALDSYGAEIDITAVSPVSGVTSGWVASGGRLIRNSGTPAASDGAVLACTTALGTINVTIKSSGTDAQANSLVDSYSVANATELLNLMTTPGVPTLSGKTCLMRRGDYNWNNTILDNRAFTSLFTIASHAGGRARFLTVLGTQAQIQTPKNLKLKNLDIFARNDPINYPAGENAAIYLIGAIDGFYCDGIDFYGNFLELISELGYYPDNAADWGWRGLFAGDGDTRLIGNLWLTNSTFRNSRRVINLPGNQTASTGDSIVVFNCDFYDVPVDGLVIGGRHNSIIAGFNRFWRPLVQSGTIHNATVDVANNRMSTAIAHGWTGTVVINVLTSSGSIPGGLIAMNDYSCTVIDATTIQFPVDITSAGAAVQIWREPAHGDWMQFIPGGMTPKLAVFDSATDRATVWSFGPLYNTTVDPVLNQITTTIPHGWTGTVTLNVLTTSGSIPGGLTALTDYSCTVVNATTVQFPVDITSAGSAVKLTRKTAGHNWNASAPTRPVKVVNKGPFATGSLPGGLAYDTVYPITYFDVNTIQFATNITSNGTAVYIVEDVDIKNAIVAGNVAASIRNDNVVTEDGHQIYWNEDVNHSSEHDANHYVDYFHVGNVGLTRATQGIFIYNPYGVWITNNTIVGKQDTLASQYVPDIQVAQQWSGTAQNARIYDNYSKNPNATIGGPDFSGNEIVGRGNNLPADPNTLVSGAGDTYEDQFVGPAFAPTTIAGVKSAFARKPSSPGDIAIPKVGHSGYVDYTNFTVDTPRVNRVNTFTITPQINVAANSQIVFGPYQMTDIDMLLSFDADGTPSMTTTSVNGAAVWVESGTNPQVKITNTSSPTASIATDWTNVSQNTAVIVNQGQFVWLRDTSSASGLVQTGGRLCVGQRVVNYSMTTIDGPAVNTFLGGGEDPVAKTSFTFANFNSGSNGLGKADAKRIIVLAMYGGDNMPTSVMLGTNAMAPVVQSTPSGTAPRLSIFQYAQGNGSNNENIVMNFPSACTGVKFMVWALYPTNPTATGSGQQLLGGITPVAVNNISVETGGFMVYLAVQNSSTATLTPSWSGGESRTQRITDNTLFDGLKYCGGDLAITSTRAFDDFAVSTDTAIQKTLVVAAWGA